MTALRNPKHEIFAQEVATGKSPLEAYKLAGFSKPRDSNARRLRNTEAIKGRIKEIALTHAEIAGAHSGAIQLELARLGFANMLDYVTIGKDGLPYVDLTKLTREQASAIAEFTVDTIVSKDEPTVTRVRFKLYDKRAALADLAKMTGGVEDPFANALTGIGEKLDRAIQRVNSAQ